MHRSAAWAAAGIAATALFAATALAPRQGAASADPAPTVFAHRGASAYAPENTLAAVRRAAALHVTWIENDVQRTRDGALIVSHDKTLARTTDVEQLYPKRWPWRIGDFDLAEIKRLDAGSWYAARYQGQRVPTLQQYLDLLDHNGQNLLLELKHPEAYPGIERQTVDTLARSGWLDHRHLTHRLVIQSSSAPALRATRKLQPAVRTGFLGNPPVARLKEYATFTDQINPPYKTVSRAYVEAVHSHKGPHGQIMRLNAWTVNSPDIAARLVELGADGIISDRPDAIRDGTR
ncbi:glycerophosphodiester phosphodiesterase [Streptomyces sp. NPDC059999]|uniref:glycerophosphodiester phosphodiesterase n=1 Tax=Streptomyces sp. NPDC059999 TaxID=3347030 RepID=UPI00368EA6D9